MASLFKDLNSLGRSQSNILIADDSYRMDKVAKEFHESLEWLEAAIENRPSVADEAYCKARCGETTFWRVNNLVFQCVSLC